MAGDVSTPALAAAVCEAGGLGFLATGYKSVEAVATDVEAVRSITSQPFGVNVFVVEPYEPEVAALLAYADALRPTASRLGVPLGDPHWDDDHYQAKVDLVLDVRPAVVSFTFGCPTSEVLLRLRKAGVSTMVTVTTAAEAREAEARGVTSLSVQGPDAGGHRGTWDPDASPSSEPLLDVLKQVVTSVDVPVVAGGGIADAQDVEGLLRSGAVAAQVGTGYLLAHEAGTNAVHRAALADPVFASTALTRAYTGRWARGLANQFMADHADAPSGYPHVHHLTAPIRAAAVRNEESQVAHLWAGTGHLAARPMLAAEITRSLAP